MAYPTTESNKLAIRWQDKGDQDAAAELYRLLEPLLHSFARKLSFVSDEDDLVADFHLSFVKALDTWDRNKAAAFSSHLYTLLHHETASRLQRYNQDKRKNLDGCPAPLATISLDAPMSEDDDITLSDIIPDPRLPAVESFTDVSIVAEVVSPDPLEQIELKKVATGEIEIYDMPPKTRASVLAALPSAKRKLSGEYRRDYPPRKTPNKPRWAKRGSRRGVWRLNQNRWAAKYKQQYLGTFGSESDALKAREKCEREAESKKKPETADEEWRIVKGCPLYEVSSCGRVRNAKTTHVLKPWRTYRGRWDGALQIELHDCSGKNHRFQLSRLVASEFKPNFDISDPTITVQHINRDQADNSAANLRLKKRLPQPPQPRKRSKRRKRSSGFYRNSDKSWAIWDGKKYVGCYPTQKAAKAARLVFFEAQKIVENK